MSLFNHLKHWTNSASNFLPIASIVFLLFAIPQAQAAPFAYISNFADDTVSVIDTEDHSLIGSPITVGAGPWGIAVSSDGSKVYVANFLGNSVSVIDTSNANSVETISFPPGSSPSYLVLTPDDSLLYVANETDNVVVIDAQANPPVIIDTIPTTQPDPFTPAYNRGIAVHPNFSTGSPYIYVSDHYNASVHRINTSTNTVDFTFPVGIRPFDIAVTPDGSKLYVANNDSANVSVINTTTNTVAPPIELSATSEPRVVTVHPFLDRAYVSSYASNTVSVINTSTDDVIAVITGVGSEPRGLTVHPDGSRVYVTSHFDNTVSVINTATNTVITPPSPIPVGNNPGSVGQFIRTNDATGLKYSVGGTVTGLTDTVILLNNGWDESIVTVDGNFTFTNEMVTGSSYNVTVKTNPAEQICIVANGTGTVSGSDVTDVQVTCEAATSFTIGGNISGLTGTVTLQNNGGDDLTLSSNGYFTFATPIADETTYLVTIATQPLDQTCAVTNESGTVSGSDVTDVQVTCEAAAQQFPWVIYYPAFVVPRDS